MLQQKLILEQETYSDNLSGIVRNLVNFLENKDYNLMIYDNINNEDIPIKDFIEETQASYIIKRNCLPYDIDIKGIYTSKNSKKLHNIIVETSPLDFKELKKDLEHRNYLLEGKTIKDHEGEKLISTITSRIYLEGIVKKRTHMTIQPHFIYDKERFDESLKVLDLIYANTLFMPDQEYYKILENMNTIKDPTIKLKMSLELENLIKQEQTMRMRQQNMYLGARASIMRMSTEEVYEVVENKIKTMSDRELGKFIPQIPQSLMPMFMPIIENRVINRIKSINPNLNYSQARNLVYSLMNKIR